MQESHVSVLLHEVIQGLHLEPDDVVVDATLGNAGHAYEAASFLSEKGMIIGIDLDDMALEKAWERLSDVAPRIELLKGNFRNIDTLLREKGIHTIDKALFDLGIRTEHLSKSKRGFSFQNLEEPLVMTLGSDDALITAHTVVNEWSEESLRDVIGGFGEEKYARRIAHSIVEKRREKELETVGELVGAIEQAVPSKYRNARIHPATRTFQAIRMAVNDELGALSEGLEKTFHLLSTGGRMAVISFHSLEDRVVKRFFKEQSTKGSEVSKKPITPTEEEIRANPRSRSAKLRILHKQ